MYDTIISAVGQVVKKDGLSELELTKKGTIAADELSFMTSSDGVFAAGDAVNKGPDIAVRAISGGKNAARAIDCYLNGKEFTPELPEYSVNEEFDASVLSDEERRERVSYAVAEPEVRKNNFLESSFTFTDSEAYKEASRCLECGCSSVYDCKLLPLMREYDSFGSNITGKKLFYKKDKSHPFIVRDNSKCILCALCVRSCKEISGTENLGLFGRGFTTKPVCAFDAPLAESDCISCGACVSVCPTGALTSGTPTVKNIVLPFTEEKVICDYCSKKCSFTRRVIGGKTVKMIPDDLRKKCSVGMFFPVAADNCDGEEVLSEKMMKSIKGDLKEFDGDLSAVTSFCELKEKLSK